MEVIQNVGIYGGIEFNDLLDKHGIPLADVHLLRHSPSEPKLRKVLPWLVSTRPEVFEAYQRTHSEETERLIRRRPYVASFIAHDKEQSIFVGLYSLKGGSMIRGDRFWSIPHLEELRTLGMKGTKRHEIFLFEFERVTTFFPEWQGRLVCEIPPGRNILRLAENNLSKVVAIHPLSILEAEMPDWNKVCLTWAELKMIPQGWKIKLREWRGIYFIFDTSSSQGYVGSAGGQENLLGRWLNYKDTGHGGNVKLKKRDPANFRFSILERVSPDMTKEDLCDLETRWKVRLHTRDYGLNDN
ncbi:GIY-YIG nuclease family protein [Corallococcus sp. AB011P]|uniref:GIY-YIG nuclease family protein n=1 Tax=Corallococcus sp. AB011P TaxID=2316735 RepID=UPI000EA3B921|nr:GIY-YIG nuclease family protein [Corallococcus sp. AB011P]RKG48025.1 GIY-YIG nuclease family protein [Corallococcus sp. AB011P]